VTFSRPKGKKNTAIEWDDSGKMGKPVKNVALMTKGLQERKHNY
jgi:hypothetical protein